MSVITQNNAQRSLAIHLNHPGKLVDNRSSIDHIRFVNEFSRLINFYDKSNQINGSWRPFVLKDPYFLSVLIANSNAVEKSNQFTKDCTLLQNLIDKTLTTHYPKGFNNLFHLIFQLFGEMNEWTELMLLTPIQYPLKTHILDTIQTILAPYFWAFTQFQAALSSPKSALSGIHKVSPTYTAKFDETCWLINKEKDLYWRILGQDSTKFIEDPQSILTTLIENGNLIFSYFTQFQSLAVESVQTMSLEKSNFPDTLLIRTFIELLQNNQLEINGLTEKHLDFYYTDLLHQAEKLAQPDHVFVSLALGKTALTYLLPTGTLFSAGFDQNKLPINFQANHNQWITSTQLNSIYTLYKTTDSSGYDVLYSENHANPNLPVKDENGIIKPWKTFGNPSNPTGLPLALGIAFASPILLLKEGERYISIALTFTTIITAAEFEVLKPATSFYLSTAKDWYAVNDAITASLLSDDGKIWTILFELPSSAPAIEVFIKSPDAISPQWPALKLSFTQLPDVANPPVVQSITIEANVSGITSFTLLNDFGSLNPSKPFQPFGPIVNLNNSFYLGQAEMFSKPLSAFYLELDWDGFPFDFLNYYTDYNNYLEGKLIPIPKPSSVVKASVGTRVKQFLNKISFGILFKSASTKTLVPTTTTTTNTDPTFTNTAFKVEFSILNDQTWSPFVLYRRANCVSTDGLGSCQLSVNPDTSQLEYQLFNTLDSDHTKVAPTTFYQYTKNEKGGSPFPANPLLQHITPYALTESTKAGFMRISITEPSYGFGNELYAKVISQIALVNASALVNTASGATPTLIPAPNSPYAPKLTGLKGTYSVSQTFDFNYGYTAGDQNSIIQCYHYSAFETYLIYDTNQETTAYQNQIGVPIIGKMRNMQGLSLYPSLPYDAVFYFQLTNSAVPNQASFYFELSNSPVLSEDQSYELTFLYLTETGWFDLTVLEDSTNNLTCSGLLVFEFPTDFNAIHFQMPSQTYWCAIGLTGNALAVPETSSVQINGVELVRTGTEFLNSATKPTIAAGQIKGPTTPIPQIASVTQTYPSYGGKGAENKAQKNIRVANRLKTKNRAITFADYKQLIAENVDRVYYSKVLFEPKSRTVQIYLVKRVVDAKATNAFLPLVSNCVKNEVLETFDGVAGFGNIEVDNFKLAYLTVNTTIYINSDVDLESTAQRITQALKVYLSPWIEDKNNQLPIDQGVNDQQIADFLSSFSEISSVDTITLNVSNPNESDAGQDETGVTEFYPTDSAILLVPNAKQLLNWKVA